MRYTEHDSLLKREPLMQLKQHMNKQVCSTYLRF